MRNFYILHKTGRILFSKNYQGDPLDRNVVVGFASSLPNLCKALLHDDVHHVVCQNSQIVLRPCGEYLILAHVNSTSPLAVVSNVLVELIRTLQLIFGHPDTWTHDNVDFDGCQDILELLCTQGLQDPCVALGGLQKIPIKNESRVRLDKLLVYLESIQGICNNATMVLVGDSVLASRFELEPSRHILYLHRARPMHNQTLSFTPVFLNSSWFGLLRTQLAVFTLVVLCHLDNAPPTAGAPASSLSSAGAVSTPLPQILAKLAEFESVFMYARLELPAEDKPALLRQYAKRETLLFLHIHGKSGTVTFPQPRPLPEIQLRELYSMFWALFGEAKAGFAVPGTREITLTREAYRFHARADADQELYVLFAADAVHLEHMNGHVQEILANLHRQ